MISLHNVSNAGQALHYFSKDDYYTQDEGLEKSEWFGKGAKRLGLTGQIEREDFFKMLSGTLKGQALGKWVIDEETGEKACVHRPGVDVTFSPPKSVSLLAEAYGRREVREAHETAVKKALGYLENTLSYTRQTEGGVTRPVRTGNLVVALFRHNTSRELDPQTHTHAVIMNATCRQDGQWRSLMNDEIYDAQRVIGAIYTSELADQLQKLGYPLRRVDEKGNFEIQGITREQIKPFSQRRTEIEAALKADGVEINTATAQQKEDATLKTRAHKKQVDHAALLTTWQTRAQTLGIDFEAVCAQADACREQGGLMRADRLTGRRAMVFAAAHLIEREAVVDKNTLLAVAIEHSVGRVSPFEVQQAFDQLEKDGDLVRLPGGHYTTQKMLASERWTLEQVRAQKGQMAKIMTPDQIAERIQQAERRQGFPYSEGQKNAIIQTLTSTDRYVAVQGLAGTGKTTMLSALREIAQEHAYTVRGMAPTGAASKTLAQETGIAADTVTMFQIKERQLQKDIAFAQQYAPNFQRKSEVWIVDESSFLSQHQKAKLDLMAEKADAKVVYLGDARQLQAVEAGKPFELAQKNGIETAYMTELNRQKTENLKEAVAILTGRAPLQDERQLTQVELNHTVQAFVYMDQAGMVREVKDDLVGVMVQDILKFDRTERERTLVMTPYNQDRKEINDRVRAGLKQQGELSRDEKPCEILVSKGWTRAMIKEAQYYQAGDVVRFGRDYQAIAAKKGEYARVRAVDAPSGIVTLQKEDGEKENSSPIAWQPRKHNKVEVYDAEKRCLAQGDLIRITRNSELFKNGEVARVTAMIGQTALLQRHQDHAIQAVDLLRHPHWDHAYAVTVHAAQGATQHRAIFHIQVDQTEDKREQTRALKEMAKVFGDRGFYVGTTRASHELRIYTNDKAAAAQAIAAKLDKTSAVGTIQHYERDRDLPHRQSVLSR